MDAMSDAIEGADVMLYGVSRPYKESANVRCQEREQAVLLFMRCLSDTALFPRLCVNVSVDWRPTTLISRSWT